MGAGRRGLTISVLTALALSAAALPAGAATRRSPTQAPANTVIDGPSSAITGLSGLAVARDGTGGLVYTKTLGGTPHAFLSSLNGTFQAPEQLDAGLGGASSQPVVAAGPSGLLVAAFVNGGTLYVDQRPSQNSSWSGPQPIYGGGSDPTLSMTIMGKAYLAFTTPGGGGHDVRAAYYYGNSWSAPTPPLDANAGDDAGSGTSRPDVMAANDGTGIIAWGEGGHIYTRRMLGANPSVAVYRADPGSFAGSGEVSADEPVVSSGGDSSYAAVAFREVMSSGSAHQTRVLVDRLHSDRYDGATGVDGLSSPAQGNADQPAVISNEAGAGFAVSDQTASHNLFATTFANNEALGGNQQINSQTQTSAPDPAVGAAGSASTLLAWQQAPGNAGIPEIRLRYAPTGTDLGPEEVLSSPGLGPTDASRGLAAAGDNAGDAAVAWIQGTGGQSQIVVAQLYQSPTGFASAMPSRYVTTPTPVLTWTPAGELWGPVQYTVRLDGTVIGSTTATSLQIPTSISQGHHSWQVSAVNRAGLTNGTKSLNVFVDSIPPRVTVRITGARHVRSRLSAYVKDSDIPRGLPRSKASWVATPIQVRWTRRGKIVRTIHRSTHTYGRRGRYVVTVTVRDKAGNRTVVTKKLNITPKAKAKSKRSKKR